MALSEQCARSLSPKENNFKTKTRREDEEKKTNKFNRPEGFSDASNKIHLFCIVVDAVVAVAATFETNIIIDAEFREGSAGECALANFSFVHYPRPTVSLDVCQNFCAARNTRKKPLLYFQTFIRVPRSCIVPLSRFSQREHRNRWKQPSNIHHIFYSMS